MLRVNTKLVLILLLLLLPPLLPQLWCAEYLVVAVTLLPYLVAAIYKGTYVTDNIVLGRCCCIYDILIHLGYVIAAVMRFCVLSVRCFGGQ